MPKGQLSDKAAQAQHICGGCPTCSPTDTKRANTTEALADDSPPELPGGSVGGSNGLSAGSSPGSTDTAAKAHSPRESSGSNAQQGALSPEVVGKLAAQASSQGVAGDATTPTTGVSPTAQFQPGVSIGGGSGEVTAKATPKVEFTYASSSATVTSSQPLYAPPTASFPASQPTQSFTASGGAGVSAAVQTTSVQGRIEVNADTRQALHRTSSREELQSPTPAAPRRELEGFAPRRVPGEMGVVQRLAPESASREMVRAGTSVAEGRSAPQRHENLAGERVVQGRPPKERSEAAEQREVTKRPETATKQDSPTLRREATQEGAIRGGRMQSDAVPRDLSPNRTARTGSARVETVRIDTARVDTVRVDTVRANSSRVDSPRVDSMRIEPMRGSSARVERFMGWASDRLSSSHTPTARTSEHLTSERPVWRQQRSEPAQRQRTEVAPAPVTRGQTVAAHSSADRRIERATPLTESVPVQRVGLRPEGVSGTQRASHSVAAPQSRTSRSEASSTERVKQRYDVPVHRRELKESRIQRDPNRGGDRAVERRSSQVRVDSAVKRGESATRGAENRRSTERAAAVPRDNQRSSPRSREALQARSAALRQAIFERINRIVTSAERLRRSNSTALASIQQLDLATRILEVLGEEEYEGISELRFRERGGVSGVRVFKRRKVLKKQEQEQQKPRLKSRKALKKQRAARASGQGGAAPSGVAQGGAAGIATGAGAAPGSALGKIVSASRGGPSKSLDIFQAKSDDDGSRDDQEG